MKIIRAEHLGMCFGVRDAISLALKQAEIQPLTILGELVHNETVTTQLQARGILSENKVESVATKTVMVTAHGASDRAMCHAQALGLKVLQATCPLVRLAHRSVLELAKSGYHPIVIGKPGHVEVRGLTEDLSECDLVLTESDVDHLREHRRFGVIAQTTQPIDKVRHLVSLIRQRFPRSEVRFVDTVCQPTKQRQASAVELAQQSDAVVVIGGWQSNNTRELVASCARYCPRVYQVQSAEDLRPDWFTGIQTVGITAGTSTPDIVINSVEDRLHELTTPISTPSITHDMVRA